MSKWNTVKNEPPANTDLLVYAGRSIYIAQLVQVETNGNAVTRWYTDDAIHLKTVSHWMSLPMPPPKLVKKGSK